MEPLQADTPAMKVCVTSLGTQVRTQSGAMEEVMEQKGLEGGGGDDFLWPPSQKKPQNCGAAMHPMALCFLYRQLCLYFLF